MSMVWNFFTKIDSENCSCNLCERQYCSSGNTTNLATHLKNKQYNAYIKFIDQNLISFFFTDISQIFPTFPKICTPISYRETLLDGGLTIVCLMRHFIDICHV